MIIPAWTRLKLAPERTEERGLLLLGSQHHVQLPKYVLSELSLDEVKGFSVNSHNKINSLLFE